jgi:hypothetical protein
MPPRRPCDGLPETRVRAASRAPYSHSTISSYCNALNFRRKFLLCTMKNRLPDPSEICALEFKREIQRLEISSVSATIGVNRSKSCVRSDKQSFYPLQKHRQHGSSEYAFAYTASIVAGFPVTAPRLDYHAAAHPGMLREIGLLDHLLIPVSEVLLSGDTQRALHAESQISGLFVASAP